MEKLFPWFGAQRLWLDGNAAAPNMFMALRKRFTAESCWRNVLLRIMADSDFMVYLDNKEITRGQFSDDPDAPTYTDIELGDIAEGEHILAVSVYCKGANFSTYTPGKPGVTFVVLAGNEAKIISDATSLVAPTPGFRSGKMPERTVQLCYTMEFDARKTDGNWLELDYDDSAWQKPFAAAAAYNAKLRPAAARPALQKSIAAKRIKSGLFCRRQEYETFAATMSFDQKFWHHQVQHAPFEREIRITNGWCFIYDLGAEQVGFVEIAVTAPAGTIVDIAHGEHLDDGCVRAECFLRNFADRYICRGKDDFFQMPFNRIGGRYIELHVLPPKECTILSVDYVGLAPWLLELPEPAKITCDDPTLNELYKLSINTLQHCMHEHYEDCPWREQALYTYDSRNQMLYGYYLWGNYDFAAASLDLIGGGVLPDGHIRLCNPTRMTLVIPVFSLVWALQIYEQTLFSGDLSLWRRWKDQLKDMCKKFMAVQDQASTLYQTSDPKFWNFYEWTPGLSRIEPDMNKVHSLYNLYLANTLESVGKLEMLDGDPACGQTLLDEAKRIRSKVEELFYLENENCYASFLQNGQPTADRHEHVQVMMLHCNIMPAERRSKVLETLLNSGNNLTPITLSVMPYLMQAIFRNDHGSAARKFMQQKMLANYYPMLEAGATTLWETALGGDDFVFAGSLCHGWSSLPVYYCNIGLMGIEPLEMGFKRFKVRPWSDGRSDFALEAVTPSGKIYAEYHRNSEGKFDLCVKYPAALEVEISEFADTPLGKVDLLKY